MYFTFMEFRNYLSSYQQKKEKKKKRDNDLQYKIKSLLKQQTYDMVSLPHQHASIKQRQIIQYLSLLRSNELFNDFPYIEMIECQCIMKLRFILINS